LLFWSENKQANNNTQRFTQRPFVSNLGEWKSREEWKKQKELEEARKAGTAAPEQDEEGRDINPHIPQYIRNAPCTLPFVYFCPFLYSIF
jgi:hypothetical protein